MSSDNGSDFECSESRVAIVSKPGNSKENLFKWM
jgi:hypothetical protein